MINLLLWTWSYLYNRMSCLRSWFPVRTAEADLHISVSYTVVQIDYHQIRNSSLEDTK